MLPDKKLEVDQIIWDWYGCPVPFPSGQVWPKVNLMRELHFTAPLRDPKRAKERAHPRNVVPYARTYGRNVYQEM